jgi:ATP-dependent DNA helicase RecQ
MRDKYRVLKDVFGYEAFRAGQEAIIDAVLGGRDALGIMPTGAGKSICYQLPALLLPGVTLVLSPLISLMKDQVDALSQNGVAAACINASLSPARMSAVLTAAEAGAYKLLYIAPERFDSDRFMRLAAVADISMVTVDEAHCVSQWGQDFRPAYLKIADFIASLPRRPIVSAFTATATPKVRADILRMLALRNPETCATGFDRKNLYFAVERPRDKLTAAFEFLRPRGGESGIIYCSTRKDVDALHAELQRREISAARYHAGLDETERRTAQDDFLYDRVRVMVATNAFGMGIDKSNVSYVLHFNMPKDIESYYQEAGRAGRDGGAADCVLLYSAKDVRTAVYLIEHGDTEYPDPDTERMLKARARERLRRMEGYCKTGGCLRANILEYFGERADGENCGNCGNCRADFIEEDVTVTAQKILSCVFRMRGRFGVNTVTDVLRGAKSASIAARGLNTLTTYGVCAESERKLKDIIAFLQERGLLILSCDEYPVLGLGAGAEKVLRGEERLTMRVKADAEGGGDGADNARIKKGRVRGTAGGAANAAEQIRGDLFARLKALRRELADKAKVPAFVVFPDAALWDMCAKMPSTADEFLNVSGVGKSKAALYGDAFLALIAAYLSA